MAEKEEENARISAEEMKKRKLDPELKRKLRMRILGETIADTVLPFPVQLAYHAYQMVTLKEMWVSGAKLLVIVETDPTHNDHIWNGWSSLNSPFQNVY